MIKNTATRYAPALVFFHWLTLLLVVAVYVFINLHDAAPKGSDFRALMKYWHYIAGFSVLLAMIVRLGVRLPAGAAPSIVAVRNINGWRYAARVMHVLLYVFFIGMALLGWFAISAGDKTIPLHLPALIPADADLYKQLKGIHKTLGVLGYWLVGLHAIAALLHHYVARDNTLLRMLPKRFGGE